MRALWWIGCVACGRVSFDAAPVTGDATAVDTLDAATKTYASTILADAPVGFWRFDEPSGFIARDLSGNGLDGTYQGGVTLGRTGALANDSGTAVALDGSTGFVRIPNSPRINTLTASIASAEGWVRGGTANGDQELWSSWDGGASGYQLIYNNGTPGTWAANNAVTSSITITDTNWHHLVSVWDATGTCYIYVDGIATGSGTCAFTTTALENQIGTQCQGPNSTICDRFRIGDVDEVAVYDYALSAAAVAAHYNAGRGVFP